MFLAVAGSSSRSVLSRVVGHKPSGVCTSGFATTAPAQVKRPQKPYKAPVIRIDSSGRPIPTVETGKAEQHQRELLETLAERRGRSVTEKYFAGNGFGLREGGQGAGDSAGAGVEGVREGDGAFPDERKDQFGVIKTRARRKFISAEQRFLELAKQQHEQPYGRERRSASRSPTYRSGSGGRPEPQSQYEAKSDNGQHPWKEKEPRGTFDRIEDRGRPSRSPYYGSGAERPVQDDLPGQQSRWQGEARRDFRLDQDRGRSSRPAYFGSGAERATDDDLPGRRSSPRDRDWNRQEGRSFSPAKKGFGRHADYHFKADEGPAPGVLLESQPVKMVPGERSPPTSKPLISTPGPTQTPPTPAARPWQPTKKLTYSAMAGIRTLHAIDPEKHSKELLSKKFGVSREAITRIIRSKFRDRKGGDGVEEDTGAGNRLRGTKWDRDPGSSENVSPVPAIMRAYARAGRQE
ncbi:hypothetical protein IAU60_000190 [Kwoniella sp. DSM 27419]